MCGLHGKAGDRVKAVVLTQSFVAKISILVLFLEMSQKKIEDLGQLRG